MGHMEPDQEPQQAAERLAETSRRRMRAALQLAAIDVPELARRLKEAGHKGYSAKTLYTMQTGAKGRVISPGEGAMIAGACELRNDFFTIDLAGAEDTGAAVFERRLRVIEDALEDLKSRTVSPETLSDAVERALDGLAQASFPGQQRDVRRPAGTDRPRGA